MSEFIVNSLISQDKALSDFRANIRANIRGLWSSNLSLYGFTDNMVGAIDRGLRQAWAEGAAGCGIAMNELTPQELYQMQDMINAQFQHILKFGDDIINNNRESGGKLEPLFARGEMWVNRYNEARIRGAALACADQKVKWVLGPTEHCRSCAGYAGKVYRYSTWANAGALPRTAALDCRGFNCQCDLVPTSERITPGRFPKRYLG